MLVHWKDRFIAAIDDADREALYAACIHAKTDAGVKFPFNIGTRVFHIEVQDIDGSKTFGKRYDPKDFY